MGIVLELLALGLISAAVGALTPILYYRSQVRKASTRLYFDVMGEFPRTEDILPGTVLKVDLKEADSFTIVYKKQGLFEFQFPRRTVIRDPSKNRVVEL